VYVLNYHGASAEHRLLPLCRCPSGDNRRTARRRWKRGDAPL